MKIQPKKEEPEIPTASMADIAFLLIVFFMLTTVFSANKGMEHILPPPDENPDQTEPDDAIYIRIFPSGQFTMDATSYLIEDVEKVYDYVNAKVQVNAKKPIIVDANPEARYGDMVAVLDQLKILSVDMKRELAITIPTPEERAMYQRMQQ